VRAPRIQSIYKAHLYCSVEDIYARGKEFHLPDEVCSMALGWKMVSGRAPASAPLVVPNQTDPNWMEKAVRDNEVQSRASSQWNVGAVVNKTSAEDTTFDLMV
jgi:hypothetical protein